MTHLYFQHMPEPWVLWLVMVPSLALLATFAYHLKSSSRPLRRAGLGFRMGLLSLALFLLLGPTLREDQVTTEAAPLALLLDDSASMSNSDTPTSGTRLQQLQSLLAGDFREQLEEDYRLEAWRFSDRLSTTSSDGRDLTATGQSSNPGDSLLALLAEHRGRRMPDVVLASDGRRTTGAALDVVADRLRHEGVKVHVLAFGKATEAPDLALERVQTPDLVLAGDVALFSLRLRASGGTPPADAIVRLLDEAGNELDRLRVEHPDENGVNLVLTAMLREAGERELVAEVLAADGETALENNRLELAVTVKEVQVRVLYVEGRPRWEYRYLKDRLLRAERDVSLHCWLADADRLFLQEHSRGLDPLLQLPIRSETLLADYDLVILGDVDPARLTPDPLDGPRFLDAVADFVQKGGGLLMAAGPKHNPQAYVGTPLEAMLPVVLGREPSPGPGPMHPLPADPQRPHPVVLFDSDPARNLELWRSSTPLWWYHPVERLKPGAQAWLVNPEVENRFGPHVIAASIYAPDGWVGWLGTDETWRWRFPGGEKYVDRFWRSALRHLAITRLRGDRGRVRLDLDRTEVELGTFIQVEARLLDDSFQPLVQEEDVPLFLVGEDLQVGLSPLEDQPGIYRGRLRASTLGSTRVFLTEDHQRDSEIVASARFHVHLSSREMSDLSLHADALSLLARRTGGRMVAAEEADSLLRELDGSQGITRVLSSTSRDLDAWPFLALFLVLAVAEWLLRKRMNLS